MLKLQFQQAYFIFMDSDGSPLPHGIEVVSVSTMELPSTDAAIPLSVSSEMCVPEPAFVRPTAFNDIEDLLHAWLLRKL